MLGDEVADCASLLRRAGADVIGANCMLSISDMVPLAQAFRKADDGLLIFQPNAGQPRLQGGATVYDETTESMARLVPDLLDAGADIIGGCCGTGPDFIRLARAETDRRRPGLTDA